MIVDITKRILIVGLGLLGGSYARGLKRFGFHISAITKEQSSINFALKEGLIEPHCTTLIFISCAYQYKRNNFQYQED